MNVVEVAGVLRRGVHRGAEVDADDLLGAECRREAEMAALAAAGVEDARPDEGVAPDGRYPAEHLRLVLGADLREARPLVAEALGGGSRPVGEGRRQQAWNGPRDRVPRPTGDARELALADVVGLRHRARQRERAPARWAGEPVDEPSLHAGRYREAQSWKARRV